MLVSFIIVIYVIIAVAQLTLADRKGMAGFQRRIGPNAVGVFGFLQPFADGLKQVQKETQIPIESNGILYQYAPFFLFQQAQQNWQVLPQDEHTFISDQGHNSFQYFIAISEFSIFTIIFSGWAANSKYPFQGSIRSTAQMISYSIVQSQILISIIFQNQSLNLLDLFDDFEYNQQLIPQALLFQVTATAETNRAPFDQPEAESELVAGFMTEHGAISFAFFFQGEYTNMITMSYQFSLFFLHFVEGFYLQFFFIWLRASLPRLRFDQLLLQCWGSQLPQILGYFLFLATIQIYFNV